MGRMVIWGTTGLDQKICRELWNEGKNIYELSGCWLRLADLGSSEVSSEAAQQRMCVAEIVPRSRVIVQVIGTSISNEIYCIYKDIITDYTIFPCLGIRMIYDRASPWLQTPWQWGYVTNHTTVLSSVPRARKWSRNGCLQLIRHYWIISFPYSFLPKEVLLRLVHFSITQFGYTIPRTDIYLPYQAPLSQLFSFWKRWDMWSFQSTDPRKIESFLGSGLIQSQ